MSMGVLFEIYKTIYMFEWETTTGTRINFVFTSAVHVCSYTSEINHSLGRSAQACLKQVLTGQNMLNADRDVRASRYIYPAHWLPGIPDRATLAGVPNQQL